MKKMIFSAVALVAFSFAGMANDGKFNTNESKVVVKAKVITGEPTEFDKGYCTATADLAEKASGQRWTHQKWSRVYDECIKGRTKSVSVE